MVDLERIITQSNNMPELPEVETVLRTLEKQLGNARFKEIQIFYNKIIADSNVDFFIQAMRGERIQKYHRIGKYMIFECVHHYFVVHLRMEGKFYLQDHDAPIDKHTHVIFHLEDGRQLRYHDTRKFGRMYCYLKTQTYATLPCFKNLGYDAFDERVTSEYLYQKAKQRKITLKQFLLDQNVMAGVGNIYADEICFACELHPCCKTYRLSKKDMENVLYHTRRILNGAIRAGGTTIRSYTSSLKVDGRFQLQLKVHERKGEACPRCGKRIEKKQINGRGTCYCRNCQKRK